MVLVLTLVVILQDSCYAGIVTDCVNAAIRYERERNYSKSIEFLDAACILEDWRSCLKLSLIYERGMWDVAKKMNDFDRTKVYIAYGRRAFELAKNRVDEMLEMMCEEFGLSGGCLQLGLLYAEKRMKEERSRSLIARAYEMSAKGCMERNDGRDCLTLANILNQGIGGVPKDVKKALELYRKACDLKVPGACLTLHYFYEAGENVPKDERKSMEYLKRGCAYFDPGSCYQLWEKTKDRKYLLIACELNPTKLCSELRR